MATAHGLVLSSSGLKGGWLIRCLLRLPECINQTMNVNLLNNIYYSLAHLSLLLHHLEVIPILEARKLKEEASVRATYSLSLEAQTHRNNLFSYSKSCAQMSGRCY